VIDPLPGHYANYDIKVYENEEMVCSGWWNFSYLEYLDSNLINVTNTILTSPPTSHSPPNGTFWLTIDTTNRWIPDGNHWWKQTWYCFWIETNVTEGSVIRMWTTNGTVVDSELVLLNEKLVDCWVVNWSEYDMHYTFLFDKITGLNIEAWGSGEHYQVKWLLVNTNVPVGIYSPSHELGIVVEAPTTLAVNESALVNATVYNFGVSNETDIKVDLLINGDVVKSTVLPFLASLNVFKLTYTWSPSIDDLYNVTGHVHPVPGEVSVENNNATKFVRVLAPPKVGVKTGDWIKYVYTITGAPPDTPLADWMKVEFLSVEEATATICVTMHMPDGTEQNETMVLDIITGRGTSTSFSGFVIPANCTTGDSIYISGYGNITIIGETIETYAGANRKTVYTSFSQYGVELTYCWDKQTGVMVEASVISGNMTATAKATETNMWQAQPLLVGDLDNDGKVGLQDLYEAALAFGSYPGHSRWNPIADINKDNKTNIVDLVLIAKNFGKNQQN